MPQDDEIREKEGEETKEEVVSVSTEEEVLPKTDAELASEYLNDLQRLQADFENFKKRQATREKEIAGYLIEKLVMDIVPVMDNFRMATEHVPEAERASPWVTGIQYIEKQLEKVLMEKLVMSLTRQCMRRSNKQQLMMVPTRKRKTGVAIRKLLPRYYRMASK